MIIPRNPETGLGKRNVSDDYKSDTGEKLKESFDKMSYSFAETVLNTSHSPVTQTIFFNDYNMLVHLLRMAPSVTPSSSNTSIKITLNSTLSYYLMIIDPTFSLPTANPKTIPRTLYELKPDASNILIYLGMSSFY